MSGQQNDMVFMNLYCVALDSRCTDVIESCSERYQVTPDLLLSFLITKLIRSFDYMKYLQMYSDTLANNEWIVNAVDCLEGRTDGHGVEA